MGNKMRKPYHTVLRKNKSSKCTDQQLQGEGISKIITVLVEASKYFVGFTDDETAIRNKTEPTVKKIPKSLTSDTAGNGEPPCDYKGKDVCSFLLK